MGRLLVGLAGVVSVLTVAVGTAAAGGGNSAAAHACQHGGWKQLVRSDGSGFHNTGECVSYAAQGGTLLPKLSACVSSENFSKDADGSQPTAFAGGTIDTAYGTSGGIRIQGIDWNGAFAAGTHVLSSGSGVNTVQLSFTKPVGSVQLDAESDVWGVTTEVTLTGYDTSNAIVDSDTATQPSGTQTVSRLAVSSATNTITHLTIATDDPYQLGLAFTNITWGCN